MSHPEYLAFVKGERGFAFLILPLQSYVQFLHQSLIVTMRGHVRNDPAPKGVTEQVKIADQV